MRIGFIQLIDWFKILSEKEEIFEMGSDSNTVWNITGKQINIANENAVINVSQNNGINAAELDTIVKGIKENIFELNREDADRIIDILEMAREELTKPTPKLNILRNCLALIEPIFKMVNGIPVLFDNLRKLQDFICNLMSTL